MIAVLDRDPDDPARGASRERKRERRPELDDLVGRDAIGELARIRLHIGAVLLNRARRELARNDAAHALVLVAVLAEHQQRPQLVQRAVGDSGEMQVRHRDRAEARVVQQRLDILLAAKADDDSRFVRDQVRGDGVATAPTLDGRDVERIRRRIHRNDNGFTHAGIMPAQVALG